MKLLRKKSLLGLIILVVLSLVLINGCKAPQAKNLEAEPVVSVEEQEIGTGLDELNDFEVLDQDLENLGLDDLENLNLE